MRRKEETSKQGQTNNKAKQHSTPKAVTFPKKNELPRVGLKPTTLYTLDRALYQLSYQRVHVKLVCYAHVFPCTYTGMEVSRLYFIGRLCTTARAI